MQTKRFVVHFVFTSNKKICIHVKALDSNSQLISKMVLHICNFQSHWAKI